MRLNFTVKDQGCLLSAKILIPSGLQHQAIHLVTKGVLAGRVAGPFEHPTLHNLRLSPVGIVPKKWRTYILIYHLSHPPGAGINHFIDKKYCSVSCTSFDEALAMLAVLGPEDLVARKDLKKPYIIAGSQ